MGLRFVVDYGFLFGGLIFKLVNLRVFGVIYMSGLVLVCGVIHEFDGGGGY